MRLEKNIVKRQEISILAEQSQPPIGAIDDVINMISGSDAGGTGH